MNSKAQLGNTTSEGSSPVQQAGVCGEAAESPAPTTGTRSFDAANEEMIHAHHNAHVALSRMLTACIMAEQAFTLAGRLWQAQNAADRAERVRVAQRHII